MLVGRRDLAALLGVGSLAFASTVAGASASTSSDLLQRNKDIIRAKYARLNAGDVPGYLRFYTKDVSNFGRVVGPAGIERIVRDILTTFPDWTMTVREMAAERDFVVARLVASGTHRGVAQTRANGGLLQGVAPTGKKFAVEHIHWYQLRDGKVAAHTAVRDDLGMMVQLGLVH